MKDFDVVDLRGARTLDEAEHWFKQKKDVAVRQEFGGWFARWFGWLRGKKL